MVPTMETTSTTDPIDILLVEDNPGDIRLTKEALAATEFDATIHTVTDGTDALKVLDERQDDESLPYPDLLLLDLNLPQMGGLDVLDAIDADSELPPLPVIVLTSSDAAEDVVSSYERSANAYLTKPTDHDEFVSMVQSVETFWIETAQLPPVSS